MTELPPSASPVERIGPGTVIREWEVVRFLGRGSYGVVFEARRSSWLDEPPRALKVFDPIVSAAARSALLGEFQALTGVRHPHLLAGIDAFDLTEAPFAGCVVFVLELADEDLAHRVARSGALPPDEVASIGAQVADGLTALHGQGRIHGDVKPENILRAGARWALGDFGVSGVLEGSYAVTAGATVDYRPPEFARAAEGARLHRSADVWALGVTLHVAATGRHPFGGPDPLMRFAAAVRGDRLAAPGLDPTLAAILDAGCLAPGPHERLDAPTVADHLRAWPRPLPGPGALPPPPTAAPAAGPTVRSPSAPGGPPWAAPSVPDPPPPQPTPMVPTPPSPSPVAPPHAEPGRPKAPGAVASRGWPAPGPPAAPDASRPAGPAAWVVAVVAGLATLAVTQLVAVLAVSALDGAGARRVAYVVVSLAVLVTLVVAVRRGAARLGGAALRWATAAAATVWAASTAVLLLG